jgi:UDP-N-acetylmuramyl pentapeptide phosphotransferase/UDP-N-acetylglucosamine-1-phosphate transferase
MIYALIFAALFVCELIYFKIADKFNIIDKPNERSSHRQITLRGGGVIFYFGVFIVFIISKFAYPYFFAGLTLISLISFADDLKPQSSKLRIAVHFSAMALMFVQWNLFGEHWYFVIIALILCTGIINAFNFMDGINGMTGIYSTVVILVLGYINLFQTQFVDNELIIVLILSLAVFNFFNFRKNAKCFAGDVGAVSIAFCIMFLLGKLIVKTQDFSYIIFLSVYGIDTVLTIIHRLILRENIFNAHRKHLYQVMANELKIPHIAVSSIYAVLQTAISSLFIIFYKFHGIFFFIIIILLSIIYILFKKKYFHLHLKNIK